MTTSPPSRARWQPLLIFAVTIALLWLSVRDVKIADTWRDVTEARASSILAAVGVTFVTYLLRARRWQALLKPIGDARYVPVLRMTVIGFMGNSLLPARAGEVLRAYLLARQEGFSASATLGSIVVERLLDVMTVLLMLGIGLVAVGSAVPPEIKAGAGLACVFGVGGLVTIFLMAGHPERIGRWAARLTRWMPGRIANAVGHMVKTFAEGLAVMRRPSDLAAAVFWSGPVWLSIALGIWLTTHAFGLTLPFVGSFLVVAYLAVGVSVPTPGGAGGFHLAYQVAMMQYFAGAGDATKVVAASFILHAVSFVPVTLVGLVFMWQDGLTLGRLKGLRAEAQAAERPPEPGNRSRIDGTGV